MEGLFQPMHLILILAIALLLFGPSKLAGLGRGLGEGIRGFKDAMKSGDGTADANKSAPVAPPPGKIDPH